MGRNNDVLDHFSGNTIVKVENVGNNGGNMMYDYGLDHRELGEKKLVLTVSIRATGAKVSLKSILGFYVKPLVTNISLCLCAFPSASCLPL